MNISHFLDKYASHPNYKSPTGSKLNTKSWQTEAPLRMLLNNLDSEEVRLEMSLPNRAGILKPVSGNEKGEEITMLVMPVMLNS